MKQPLRTVFLWHMHQPSYLDPETNTSLMPWVRLHAIKDYYDMARIVDEVKGAKVVINFVPSLWDQIEAIANGRELDLHEIISRKRVEDLTDDEKLYVAKHFFSCQVNTMILPYKEYKSLYFRFGPDGDKNLVLQAKDQSICDLQVWYHLTWCGHSLREKPFVDQLFKKGSNFTHEEKTKLLDIQRELLAEIPIYYRELIKKGKIEVSSTPYYHPILPLLLEPDSAHVACPQMELPNNSFSLEKDAEWHLQSAIKNHNEIFGVNPVGFWPAEGSVSSKALEMFKENGVKWVATDEEVLRLSLKKDKLSAEEKYRLYSHKNVNIFFRDHSLSDQIGFVYQGYKAKEAVKEFMGHLHSIHEALPNEGDFVVPVILDGENCWEFYEQQGRPFLLELYSNLVNDPLIKMQTCEEIISDSSSAYNLDYLHTGSWIDANFTTWVGDPVKNRGWEYLYKARTAVAQAIESNELNEEQYSSVMREVYAAEGSDWFWWFGEGHSSEYDSMFDLLFRKRLMHIYKLLGMNIPAYLEEAVDDSIGKARYTLPTEMISPQMDGLAGSYMEWMSAGECSATGGSMQKSTVLVDKINFGFDREFLYLKISGNIFKNRKNLEGKQIVINLQTETNGKVKLKLAENGTESVEYSESDAKKVQNGQNNGIIQKLGEYLEVALPLVLLGGQFGHWKQDSRIGFNVALVKSNRELERLPEDGYITFDAPDSRFVEQNWFV